MLLAADFDAAELSCRHCRHTLMRRCARATLLSTLDTYYAAADADFRCCRFWHTPYA